MNIGGIMYFLVQRWGSGKCFDMKNNLKKYSDFIDKVIELKKTNLTPGIESESKEMLCLIEDDYGTTKDGLEKIKKSSLSLRIFNWYSIYMYNRLLRKLSVYYIQCVGILSIIKMDREL